MNETDVMRLKRKKRHAILRSLMGGAKIKAACKKAGIDPVTFWRWKEESPRLKALVFAIKSSRVEIVEDELYHNATVKKNVTAQIYFLRCNYPEIYNRDHPLIDFSDRRETHHHITNNVKVESNEQLTKELAERSSRIEKLRGIAFSKGDLK